MQIHTKIPDARNSDGLFKKMVETSPDGILLINTESLNIEVFNPSFARLLNLSENILHGKKIIEINFFRENDLWQNILNDLKSKPTIRYENLYLESGANEKIYVEIIGHVFYFNNIRYIKLHIRNDTQRYQMEEELRHSELSLKEAQHQARIGSWTWNPKTDEITWSEEMFQIFDMDTNKPPANFKKIPNLYTPESWEKLKTAVENTLNSGATYELDTEVIKKNGIHLWVTSRGAPLRDAKGNIIGLRGSVQDINDRKVAEVLEAESEMLKRADKMKSMFLANMSHELRSPLNSIIGFSEMLQDGLLDDLTDRQRKYIGYIFSSGEHLLSLINDILDLSKVESGKMTLDLGIIDISSLFSNAISMVRENALKHRITLLPKVEKNIGALMADSRKVKQIVFNLLSNAIKFTEDGGKVTMIIRRVKTDVIGQPSGTIPWRIFNPPKKEFSEFIEIRVIDNGIGIAPDALDQLFQPFSQIDNELSRKFEGTGLGLALVKQMTELHGGTVMVESAPGQGSQFTVWLPFRLPIEKPTVDPVFMILPDVKTGKSVKQKVMVIEDDDQAAELIRLQLDEDKLEVLHVRSAEAALELLKQVTPDLITLDILLPGMDGWEFLGRIKQMKSISEIPVVVISMVASETKGISLGASAVLKKPIGRIQLHKTLSNTGFNEKRREIPYEILVVDDDSEAVKILSGYLNIAGFHMTHASDGQEGIELAHKLHPDLILLELMMTNINGIDVVRNIKSHRDTMNIPVIMISSRTISEIERHELKTLGLNIHGKSEINNGSFMNEVRRALSVDINPARE